MNRTRFSLAAFSCPFLFLLIFVFATHAGNHKPVADILPSPGFADGWANSGSITTYTSDNLYKHINGEAELYYPYGFRALATTVYVRKENPGIGVVADIYEMASPLDAFGIYSRYRDADEEPVNIGTEGFVNDSQLLFAKDRYFVRLAPSGTVTLDKSVFVACAKAIAQRITGGASPPKELNILAIEEVIRRSETYVPQAVLGYPFFKRGLLADGKLGEDMARVFIIFEDSERTAGQAFQEYRAYLEKSGASFTTLSDKKFPTLIAQDPLYKGLVLSQSGAYLVGAAKLSNPSSALTMVKKIQSRLPIP